MSAGDGAFFDPPDEPAPHHCRPPEPLTGTPRGWRCSCGKAYVKEQEHQHGETWWQWRRATEHDQGRA